MGRRLSTAVAPVVDDVEVVRKITANPLRQRRVAHFMRFVQVRHLIQVQHGRPTLKRDEARGVSRIVLTPPTGRQTHPPQT